MTATCLDLFCGAGGSSEGARRAGLTISLAANHWQTAIDVHQLNHPDTAHDCADISQVDPRRYPRTNILIASPECTNHSQARGVSRKRQDASLWDAPDPMAERSRATMWDVVRFAEQMDYDAIIVENVVEAVKWVLWPAWLTAMTVGLGYQYRILSHNAMHHGVAQSRDRIFVVLWKPGLNPNLELELDAWCPRCEQQRVVRQSWKNGRSVGRYRQQWVWSCTTCGTVCEPDTEPAASIIDWSLPTPRIGDRERPLAPATRTRIAAGLARYGWLTPVTTSGAGNTHERTPGNRARPVSEPVAVQQTTLSSALATPPGFQMQVAHGKTSPARFREFDKPAYTATGSIGEGLVLTNRIHATPKPVDDPLTTVVAGGNHHALVVRSNGFVGSGDMGRFSSTPDRPLPTVVTSQRPALIMRNNPGGAEMVTPVEEPVRTLTSKGHQSLLVPYYSNGVATLVSEPSPTLRTKDTVALVDPDEAVDDCGFRMFEPYEVAAAQGFPVGYIPRDLTKVAQVKLAGNAVPPAMMFWIAGRVLQALEAAAA